MRPIYAACFAAAFAASVATVANAQLFALGYRVPTDPITITQPIRVIDADTFDVGAERIRINNLDAPETFRPHCDAERELGTRATVRARELIAAARVVTIYPERRRDRTSRVLARVEVDGQDLATLLIGQGLGRPWRGRTSDWCAS